MKYHLNVSLQGIFYILAGINHFVDAEFYLNLIPPYFEFQELINILAGIVEVLVGTALLFSRVRKPAAYGIMVMLIAFIPSHIYFIQLGSCIDAGLCVTEWIGWGRLLVIHPLLLYWAWNARAF